MRKQGSCLEKGNAGNNARCTQARKTTHGLDEQHQDVDRTLRGRVSQNDRGQRKMEIVRPWCGQPSDRGRLKNRTDLYFSIGYVPPSEPALCQLYRLTFVPYRDWTCASAVWCGVCLTAGVTNYTTSVSLAPTTTADAATSSAAGQQDGPRQAPATDDSH